MATWNFIAIRKLKEMGIACSFYDAHHATLEKWGEGKATVSASDIEELRHNILHDLDTPEYLQAFVKRQVFRK
jgi:hypothetical protein